MLLVFDPRDENDLAEIQIPQGARMLTLKRGALSTVNDAVGAGLLKSNPELYRLPTKAETAKASPEAAALPATPKA